MYCLNLLAIALELAQRRSGLRRRRQQVLGALPLHRARDEPPAATTAQECGTKRTDSSTTCCTCPDGSHVPLKVRSMVGLIPLFAVETLEPEICDKLARLQAAAGMVHRNRPDLTHNVACMRTPGDGRTTAAVDRRQRPTATAFCKFMLDESEFLSPYGIRALSRFHHEQPYVLPRQRHASIASTTSRRILAPDCSAAIPTGAGRSGSR